MIILCVHIPNPIWSCSYSRRDGFRETEGQVQRAQHMRCTSPAFLALAGALCTSKIRLTSLPRRVVVYPPVTTGNALLSAGCQFQYGSQEGSPGIRTFLGRTSPPLPSWREVLCHIRGQVECFDVAHLGLNGR